MGRKLMIDGNAVYEIDEDCMLRKKLDTEEKDQEKQMRKQNYTEEYKKNMRQS